MIDCVTEIPLPGRTLAAPGTPKDGSSANPRLPAFVAGPENRIVAGTIDRMMQSASATTGQISPKRSLPSPLVLFGASGTGKTHLARGLVSYWQEQRGAESAAYMTAAEFRHRFNDAIKRNVVHEFRAEVRGRELLAIDDLHHLPADEHILQELRYTLDEYEERGGTVVVTSAQPISALPNVGPDLRSRLAAGLVMQLSPPGNAARVRIIRHASQAHGRPLADDAANRLAHGLSGSANHLFGAVLELLTAASRNCESDEKCVELLLASRAARRPTLREIVAVVARYQNITQAQLKSSSRRQSIVFARAVVVYLARELAATSYDQIGRALGGRDHTTIIHNYRKIEQLCERDPQTQELLEDLRRILLSR